MNVVFFYVFALLCRLLNCFQSMEFGGLVDFLTVLRDSGWCGHDLAGFFLYLDHVEPRCAMLGPVVLCWAKLCDDGPRCPMLCQVALCFAKLCHVVPKLWYVYVVPRCAMLAEVVLWWPRLCYVVPSCAMLGQVVLCLDKMC